MKNNSRTRMRRMERTERIRSATIRAAYPRQTEQQQRQTATNDNSEGNSQLPLETPSGRSACSDANSSISNVSMVFQKVFCCCLKVLSFAVSLWLLSFSAR